jgi:hypothetical protein
MHAITRQERHHHALATNTPNQAFGSQLKDVGNGRPFKAHRRQILQNAQLQRRVGRGRNGQRLGFRRDDGHIRLGITRPTSGAPKNAATRAASPALAMTSALTTDGGRPT